MPGAGTALGQNLSVRSGPKLIRLDDYGLSGQVRVGSPKLMEGILALRLRRVKDVISWIWQQLMESQDSVGLSMKDKAHQINEGSSKSKRRRVQNVVGFS
jgi:hypothetical protein